jgi:hypothetical protein
MAASCVGSHWPNPAIELTATRRTTSFSMTSTLLPAAQRAVARSALSLSR